MIEKTFERIPNNRHLMLQSDQGWQYQMHRHQYLLEQKSVILVCLAYMDNYNYKRIKSKLKGLSPVQYKIQSSRAA